MVFEERYGDRVTCPHCETKGALFEEIPTSLQSFEEAAWNEHTCARCRETVLYKRVHDYEQSTSLWIADRTGEPIRRYVIFPEANGRRVLWRMFVEDPLHTLLARQGYYDLHLRRVRPTTTLAGRRSSDRKHKINR